ncbi:MAG: hypothetical protein KA297_14985 [Kofleriaceae bacterium]|nr:hypothetical protein [Kofleriaceae bacterium]
MFNHVGHVYYNETSASPLVVGDFVSMKRWPGSPDGSDGFTKFKSAKGLIFDLQLSSPDVFVDEDATSLTLLAPMKRTGWTLAERFEADLDGVQQAVRDGLDAVWHEDELLFPSGAVVVAIAYNATPEVGAETDQLDPACFGAATPRLPVDPPTTPLYAAEPVRAHELAIVPVRPGTYRVLIGTLTFRGAPVARATLSRVGD